MGSDDIVARASTPAGLTEQPPTVSPTAAYAIFDGLFQRALLRHLSGHAGALDQLATESRSLLPTLVQSGA